MKKMPTLFMRNPDNMGLVTSEVNPNANGFWMARESQPGSMMAPAFSLKITGIIFLPMLDGK